jgi:hypothetical protein
VPFVGFEATYNYIFKTRKNFHRQIPYIHHADQPFLDKQNGYVRPGVGVRAQGHAMDNRRL